MPGMAEFFSQLEAYNDLEASIIRGTKIHKVLKAIVKLASVPKDDEFHFKKRSSALLEVWNACCLPVSVIDGHRQDVSAM